MAEEEAFLARRVLVGVDASAQSLHAVSAAAALAARLGAELAGLFVEDEDLLRLAELPFGDLVQAPGGGRERLDRASAEAALRAFAWHARQALERAASSHRLACSFRVRRGRVAREVLAAADPADLLVLGAAGQGRTARGAVGETARAALAGARAPVLLMAGGVRLGEAVVVLDDGTPAGARALAAARRVAPAGRPPAVVRSAGPGATLADPLVRLDAILLVLARAPLQELDDAAGRVLAAGGAVLVVR